MVPGAAHGLAHHQPLGERPVIVRARGADREELLAPPCQQHRLAAHVSDEHGAIGEGGRVDAGGKVRPLRQIRSFFRHYALPVTTGLAATSSIRADIPLWPLPSRMIES